VLPDEAEQRRQARLEAELNSYPARPEQLQAHMTYLPHPQPWNAHNTEALRECLLALGIQPEGKTTVRTFLNRILGAPIIKQNALFEVCTRACTQSIWRGLRNSCCC
jgi:hypothetical protein